VGTYTFKNDLCILLYPAAEWNLEEFMEAARAEQAIVERASHIRDLIKIAHKTSALIRFFKCLSHALEFLHSRAVKHMDLKPKNLLVRDLDRSSISDKYRIYIADFGIARSYQSAAESETDSPTPFTRKYAAPEVVLQKTRGFKADIFSLGCIYMEMVATIMSVSTGEDKRGRLQSVCCTEEGDASYQANITSIMEMVQA
jgi:serine/threonine protein kinase